MISQLKILELPYIRLLACLRSTDGWNLSWLLLGCL